MIKLNDDEIQILGTPCFASANYAKLLIAAGIYEDKEKKAEYERVRTTERTCWHSCVARRFKRRPS